MTVSANASLEFTRDQITRMAYQLCGLVGAGKTPKPAQYEMAGNFLNLHLEALQAEGIISQSLERTTLTLVDGTASYTLPSAVTDVWVGPNDQAGAIVPSSGAESLVTVISMSDYLSLADKTTEGRPRRVLIERQANVQLTFWPIPDSTVTSFRYAKVRLFFDADTGAVTLDLQRRWLRSIAYLVAGDIALAESMPLDRVQYLTGEGERLKGILKADDGQRGSIRFVPTVSARRW